MKLYILGMLLAMVMTSECWHTFMGTNVMRWQAYHKTVKFSANSLTKRIENVNYTVSGSYYGNLTIQGILAYDLTDTGESRANVTSGGLGYNYVNLSLMSDCGKPLQYDIYVYV